MYLCVAMCVCVSGMGDADRTMSGGVWAMGEDQEGGCGGWEEGEGRRRKGRWTVL